MEVNGSDKVVAPVASPLRDPTPAVLNSLFVKDLLDHELGERLESVLTTLIVEVDTVKNLMLH
jgi:hypothetical protein